MRPERFLTAEQQETVVAAVRLAEKDTSGEIRIHIDSRCTRDPKKRAEEVFRKLGMQNTELHNGVLIYLAYESKVFAIIGDKGINDLVPDGFWEDVLSVMRERFRRNKFTEDLSDAAIMVGEKLKAVFPYQKDDINEQPDDISFGQN